MAQPRYTIIVPVHNGGDYFKQCVQSVLAQTHTDFELAVLENGSTDGTAEWIATVKDERIKVYPSKSLLVIEENWARVVQIPKCEFVTFMGHDDLLDPDYLATIEALQFQYPDAALYHTRFRFIDSEGAVLHSCRPMPERETAAEFLQSFLLLQRDANGTGYVMRSHAYDVAGGIPPFPNLLYADHALWLALLSGSYIVTSTQERFSYRIHSNSTTFSSSWQKHLEAIDQFIDFFQNYAGWKPDEKAVYDRYGKQFFYALCETWYRLLLVRATKKNKRLDPAIGQRLRETLKPLDAELAETFRSAQRLRRLINSNVLSRLAYIAYILLRYGREELRVDV